MHAFLDGRDVDQKSALKYIEETEAKFKELGVGQFASVSGRYYAMDRDKRWDREQKAYNAIRNFEGPTYASAKEGVEANYSMTLLMNSLNHSLLIIKIMALMTAMLLYSTTSVLTELLNFQKFSLIKHLMVSKLNKLKIYSMQRSRNT